MHRRSLFAAAILSLAGLASAQSAYPGKAITMIVPFPPGGLADIVARPVAEAMSRDLGQPVVIENRGGAGGGIGMAQVAKSPRGRLHDSDGAVFVHGDSRKPTRCWAARPCIP